MGITYGDIVSMFKTLKVLTSRWEKLVRRSEVLASQSETTFT